ncbi:hypothetical protein LSTR_LSTR007079 [Laodelphax striatellus]|uniref:C2H2-type domain-containing protein n=1 Tax=Laodelphax striatellus TaxID=195883 RepID=A0A482WFN2_LAOST|nr:hypothetical protein LSTR_LSTR007079 [Laodelphax striatellus]
MFEDEIDDPCDTQLPTSRISSKTTGGFKIVLKKRQKNVSPSYFNGKLRKSSRKGSKSSPKNSELGKTTRKTTPEKTCTKSMRKTNDSTPVKSCDENDSKFVDRSCQSTPGEDSSVEVGVSKSVRKNDLYSFIDFNGCNVLRSVRNSCVSSSKKLNLRNGVWKSKSKLDDSSPKKEYITAVEDLKFVRKLDEESHKNSLRESNNDFENVSKLNNVSPKNYVLRNLDMNPLDTTLETSKDLIIDTSVSYCKSDNNDSFKKNEEIGSFSDGIPVDTNCDKNPTEVNRTDFFLNLDLVSSTPIFSRKVNGGFLSEKEAFDGNDDVLKNKNKICRQLNMGENVDISKIVNFEDSPKRMPTSILKSASSVKSKSPFKRIVHFEDDLDKNLSWKFCKRLTPDLDTSKSVNEIDEAKNDSSSKSQNSEQLSNRSQIYRCRLCKKRFTSKELLQAHLSINMCMVKISNLN